MNQNQSVDNDLQKAIDDNAEQQRAIIQEIRDFLHEIRK